MRCPLQRKHMSESRSMRTAIRAMLVDGFSPDEIVIGLGCRLSEVEEVLRQEGL